MKHTIIYKTLFALAVTTVLASCSGIADTKSEATGAVVVSGSLALGGALPQTVLAANKTARTVTATLPAITYSVTAQKGTETVSATVDGTAFTFAFATLGTWTITASGTDGTGAQVVSGSVQSDVSATGTTISVPVTPSQNGRGKVSLTLTDKSAKIAAVTVYVLADGEKTALTAADFSDGTATIAVSDVDAGIYQVLFDFTDATGNTLYTCRETATVYNNLTTDTWYGTAPYLQQNAAGSYDFVLTEALIAGYDAEIVPTTKTVLYTSTKDAETNTTTYNYYLADSADDSLSGDAVLTGRFSTFAFDKNGALYTLGATTTTSGGYTYTYATLKSNRSDFTESQTNASASSTNLLAYDSGTDTLWLCTTSSDTSFYGYADISSATGFEDSTASTVYCATGIYTDSSNDLDKTISPKAFAVHDGIFYIAGTASGSWYLASMNPKALLEDSTNFRSHGATDLGLSDSGLSSAATITDILYQDGAVYLLLRDVNTAISSVQASRGAVIKYDTHLGTVAKTGWSAESVQNTAMNASYKMYAFTNDDKQLYKTYDTDPLIISGTDYFEKYTNSSSVQVETFFNTKFPSFYAPNIGNTTLSENAFYGPQSKAKETRNLRRRSLLLHQQRRHLELQERKQNCHR